MPEKKKAPEKKRKPIEGYKAYAARVNAAAKVAKETEKEAKEAGRPLPERDVSIGGQKDYWKR